MILVTGPTGNTGGAVLAELATGEEAVRALVRSRGGGVDELEECFGVEAVEGDFERPETLGPAMEGVDRLYLATSSGSTAPEQLGNALDVAVSAGVSHVVKVSPIEPPAGHPLRFADWHGQVDERLKASGLGWTILRAGWFMQNLLMQAPAIAAGRLVAPLGDARVAMVDARDVGTAAAAVLAGDGHLGRVYVITGPEALRQAEVAGILSEALERPVAYVDVTDDEARAGLAAAGAPAETVDALMEVYAAQRAGINATVSGDYHALVGGPPTALAAWAADYRSLLEAAASG
jgi:uncharacterized protein YbjT (DUF2867 family)